MRVVSGVVLALLVVSCFHAKEGRVQAQDTRRVSDGVVSDSGSGAGGGEMALRLRAVVANAELPGGLADRLEAQSAADGAFFADLAACLAGDVHLRELVDKQRPLPSGYAPSDLVTLAGGSYQVSRAGLTLRGVAAGALEEMAAAARADGVTLVASSAYRSYDYQAEVYSRIVREMGQEAADRESARPGHSQHQTGLAADFGSIDDSFAQTAAGRWMAANASRYGWSLSYPQGFEEVTGYRWESWHFRYVGKDLAAFIDRYFDGIQQYALRFLHEWALYQ
ncbi:MAG: M15 family metallopeptidase [Treponema sp.]|nr:M15 family metallopeptidase [Treponema sp.]